MTTAQDTLLFFYYGGMVYTGVKMFDEAIEFYATVRAAPACRSPRVAGHLACLLRVTLGLLFAQCISVPAKALSAIVVEAAKKFILVSLIHTGAVRGCCVARTSPCHVADACAGGCGACNAGQDAKYPGSTSPVVANSLAHHVSPYRQLATFYKALNAAKTESAIAAGKRAFVKVRVAHACAWRCGRRHA